MKNNVSTKYCALVTGCPNETNNRQKDNEKDLHVGMPMYNSLEYSVNYSKISKQLIKKYCRKKPSNILTNSGSFITFDLIFADDAKSKGEKRSRKGSSTFEQAEYFLKKP